MIWMEQRDQRELGGESVNGYLEGTGGADDAMMGFYSWTRIGIC